ncbi:MAG: hypothetical protein MJ069_07660 [Salinivirgaceae bacterium]|nr:hypothetical protein [Salinivirgaceae bacterium]
MKKLTFALLASLIVLFANCGFDNSTCEWQYQSEFEFVEFPDTVKASQKFTVDYKVPKYDCMTAIDGPYVVNSDNGDTTQISIFIEVEKCECKPVTSLVYRSKVYFSLDSLGMHYFKYLVIEDSVLHFKYDSVMVVK